jgi:hypothetical protein
MSVRTFWAGDHALQPVLADVEKRLMTVEGPTAYLETEVLRSASRISYDYFNNGFGNDVSQAVAYIDRYHVPYATPEFLAAWQNVRDIALWGEPVRSCPEIDGQITLVSAEILQRVAEADRLGLLNPRGPEMYDMPSVEPGYDPEMGLAA